MRGALAFAALAAIVAAILLSADSSTSPQPPRSPAASATALATRTPTPPRLDRAVIDRQDRTNASHRAREAEVFDARPLLSRLPLSRAGVRIDIGGLAGDDRTTVLAIDPGVRSRAHARAVYRTALALAGDAGDAYVLEWER